MDSQQYWDNKIIEWENSMHGAIQLSFIERAASLFRGSVKFRGTLARDIVRPFVEGKTVVELGCGSGYFALDLCATTGVKKVIGIDISKQAIARAKKLSVEKGVQDRCEFYTADVIGRELPEANITIGLGFLDYLNAQEVAALFAHLKSPYFLFSVTERKVSLLRYIHILYLLSQGCSKHFYYTRKEIKELAKGREPIQFVDHQGLSFACLVHNLPITSNSV